MYCVEYLPLPTFDTPEHFQLFKLLEITGKLGRGHSATNPDPILTLTSLFDAGQKYSSSLVSW